MLTNFLRNFFYIKDANSSEEVHSVEQALSLIQSLGNNSNLVEANIRPWPPINDLGKQSLDTITATLTEYVKNNFTPTDTYYSCAGEYAVFSKKKKPSKHRISISYCNRYVVEESGVPLGFASFGGINFGADERGQKARARLEELIHVSRKAVLDFYIK